MKTTALARQNVALLPRDKLERVALQARRQLRNQSLDVKRMKQRGLALLAGGIGAAIVGFVMGSRMREKDLNVANIEAGLADDPTKVFGVDLDLVVGGGITLVGIVAQGSASTRDIGEYVESAGHGALFFWIGSRAQQAAYASGEVEATSSPSQVGLAAA